MYSRQIFLIISISLTVFGCVISAFSLGLVQWQVCYIFLNNKEILSLIFILKKPKKYNFKFLQYVEMREFNSFHEHGIFADCVSSEVMSLAAVRNPHEALEGEEVIFAIFSNLNFV